jgi:hypothetical protein
VLPLKKLEVQLILLNHQILLVTMKFTIKIKIMFPCRQLSTTLYTPQDSFTGFLRDRLKYSIARHLFKNGNKNDISNCRPILILKLLLKIFEKVMQT